MKIQLSVIDFVADTGDDYDVSLAVGRMLFAEYALSVDQSRRLPRGDILVFGGDIAYLPEVLRGRKGCIFRDRLGQINNQGGYKL